MDLQHSGTSFYLVLTALLLGALGIILYWLMFVQQIRLQDILAR